MRGAATHPTDARLRSCAGLHRCAPPRTIGIQLEFWFYGAAASICRQLTGKQEAEASARVRLRPISARRAYAALARFLGTVPWSTAPRATNSCSIAKAGRLPITNADPYLNRLLIEVSEETLSRQRARASSSFAARVENAIAPLLPHGRSALASKISSPTYRQ